MTFDPNDFKRAMGQFASGVTVVTSKHGETPIGITASSFTSLSLDPPLVLVSLNKKLFTHNVIAESGFFAVNVLSARQLEIGMRFAGMKPEIKDRFAGLKTYTAVTGSPLLPDSLAWVDCTVWVAGPATSTEYLPLQVAQAEGYFAQEKLDVTLTVERNEGEAAQALARGRADIAATSLDAAYRLGHVAGAPPPLFFGLTAAAPVAIVVSPNHKDTLRSPAELRGQPVGLPGAGTPEHTMLNAVLIRAGVKIHQVPIRSFSTRALEGALARGEVAAGVMADPTITRMVEDGTGSILVDLRPRADAARWLGAETVHAALFLRAAGTLDERDLTALARALLRAVARVTEATPEALLAVLPAAVTGQPTDFRVRLEGARQSYLPRGQVTDDMLKASINQARERGPFPSAVKLPWLSWSSLLLSAPLQRAIEAPSSPAR